VAYYASKALGGVNSIVALDSACDGFLTNALTSAEIDFSRYTRTSWAFESSIIGSNARAFSADYSFRINSSFAERITGPVGSLLGFIDTHGYAVTAFSALIKMSLASPNTDAAQFFSLMHLLNEGAPASDIKPDAYQADSIELQAWGKGFDAEIDIDSYAAYNPETRKYDWWKAAPRTYWYDKIAAESGEQSGASTSWDEHNLP
jgi:hypothetical protein